MPNKISREALTALTRMGAIPMPAPSKPGEPLTFVETMLMQTDVERELGNTVCKAEGHQVRQFMVRSTGKPMKNWGYCERCLHTMQKSAPTLRKATV